MSTALPAPLASIRDDFLGLPESDRLSLLLEFSEELPETPDRYADASMERVVECQSPVFISIEVNGAGVDAAETLHGAELGKAAVEMFAKAPPEAPTTRGFASILVQGISGLTVEQALAVPIDFPFELGLSRLVSPLRLRGMVGMLGRVQRQVREIVAAA